MVVVATFPHISHMVSRSIICNTTVTRTFRMCRRHICSTSTATSIGMSTFQTLMSGTITSQCMSTGLFQHQCHYVLRPALNGLCRFWMLIYILLTLNITFSIWYECTIIVYCRCCRLFRKLWSKMSILYTCGWRWRWVGANFYVAVRVRMTKLEQLAQQWLSYIW